MAESLRGDFHIGDVLSLTTGKSAKEAIMLSPEGLNGIHRLISHITGEAQLSGMAVETLAPICRERLFVQYPALRDLDDSGIDEIGADDWLKEQEERLGTIVKVWSLFDYKLATGTSSQV